MRWAVQFQSIALRAITVSVILPVLTVVFVFAGLVRLYLFCVALATTTLWSDLPMAGIVAVV